MDGEEDLEDGTAMVVAVSGVDVSGEVTTSLKYPAEWFPCWKLWSSRASKAGSHPPPLNVEAVL